VFKDILKIFLKKGANMKYIAVVIVFLFVFGMGGGQVLAHEGHQNEMKHGPEFEKEMEFEYEVEIEHCPGGGNIFTTPLNVQPAGNSNGNFSLQLRHHDCVPEIEVEIEHHKFMDDTIHVSGEYEIKPDDSLSITNMTASRSGTVTSIASDNVTFSCTQNVSGDLNPTRTNFNGTVVVTCTVTGDMKIKTAEDLALKIFPGF
jgi:hypothetical protein